MFEDSSWLVLIAILPLTYFVASMRERLKSVEKKLSVALEDYEVLRNHLYAIGQAPEDPRYPVDETE
ncbi:MAG: hypothetical protein R3F22_09105 [Lysobacteraceae bacterium]